MALEQRPCHRHASPWGLFLHRLRGYREVDCQNPSDTTPSLRQQVDYYHVCAERSVRLRLAGQPLFPTDLLPGGSGVLSTAKCDSHLASPSGPQHRRRSLRPDYEQIRKVCNDARNCPSERGTDVVSRFAPILFVGMALWTLGSGLKLIFSRTSQESVHVVVLLIEGIGIGFVHQPALVALQALSKPADRAVATSTRNLMRMLGSVVGMALATAVQNAVMTAALPSEMPELLRASVIGGTWERGHGESGSEAWDSMILDAKMKGVHTVFVMLAPLMSLCLAGCWFIPNIALEGDDGRP